MAIVEWLHKPDAVPAVPLWLFYIHLPFGLWQAFVCMDTLQILRKSLPLLFLRLKTRKTIQGQYLIHTHTRMIDIEDAEQKLDMLNVIKEISAELSKMDDSRDQIKEIIGAAAEAFTLPKPLIRKVARLYHKKNVADFENETSDIKNLYKAITVV